MFFTVKTKSFLESIRKIFFHIKLFFNDVIKKNEIFKKELFINRNLEDL